MRLQLPDETMRQPLLPTMAGVAVGVQSVGSLSLIGIFRLFDAKIGMEVME